MKTIICAIPFAISLFAISATFAENEQAPSAMEKRPLDGVFIEAVETYPNQKSNHFGLGLGLYPFNAYYSGITLNTSFQFQLSRAFSWEILNASLAYTFDKGLTTELADRFAVNPEVIERMQFMVSSNILYNHSNGKFVFLDDSIHYFRSSVITGLGLVKTSQTSSLVVNLGARLEVFTRPSFAWYFDIRDSVAASSKLTQYITFTIGSILSF